MTDWERVTFAEKWLAVVARASRIGMALTMHYRTESHTIPTAGTILPSEEEPPAEPLWVVGLYSRLPGDGLAQFSAYADADPLQALTFTEEVVALLEARHGAPPF